MQPARTKGVRSSQLTEYKTIYDSTDQFQAMMDGNQPGDPKLAAKYMVDLVKREGIAKGQEVPLRVVMGTDAYGMIKEKCERELQLLEDWKDMTCSTDLPKV